MRVRIRPAQPRLFKTPVPCELVSSVPAPDYTNNLSLRTMCRIAHLQLPPLRAGVILDVRSNFQCTSEYELTELCYALVLTPDQSGTAGINGTDVLGSPAFSPGNGRLISLFAGYNLTPNAVPKFPNGGMHHGFMPVSASIQIPSEYEGVPMWVAIIGYAAGTTVNNVLFIDQCGAFIHATVHP